MYLPWGFVADENMPGMECAFVTVAQDNEPSELKFLPCTADNQMRYICQTGRLHWRKTHNVGYARA